MKNNMGIISILKSRETFRLRKYRIYPNLLKDYIKPPVKMNIFRVFSIHRKGFLVSDWALMGLNKENYKKYLSSKQYVKYHPINGYYSKIIDDKTVIKYVVNGTECAKYMPDYYFLIDEEGYICPMMDWKGDKKKYAPADIWALLQEKGRLALKLATGSIGKGFYKAEFEDGHALVNGEAMDEAAFSKLIGSLKNYIICEYLVPHAELAKFWPKTPNTMRYLVGKRDGEFRMIKGYIRFGSKKSGVVENFNNGGIMCYLDKDGYFDGGYVINRENGGLKADFIRNHPDTGTEIKGRIPCWDELEKAVAGMEKLLPMTKYLGFDFVITDKNEVKILEINSLTSLDTIQADGSILETENGRWFFESLKEM